MRGVLFGVPPVGMRVLVVVLGILVGGQATLAAEHTRDTPEQVKQAIKDKKAVIVDVREQSEWDEGHLADAVLLPLSRLKNVTADQLPASLRKDQTIYLHCGSGKRCLRAADELKKLGYDVRPLREGYADLLKSGFEKAK